ncbi:MAG: ATP synthase subunit I [Deltaproteobacteria bacterium]|jgi:hypothetical protein|nr:ATP synthase subunit I [Deltaproteobacteria bacterium]
MAEKNPEEGLIKTGGGPEEAESAETEIDPLQREVYEVQRKFIKEILVYSARLRLIFRLLAVVLIIFLFFKENVQYSLGALLGALVADFNLSIFHYVVKTSDPRKKGSPVIVTIFKFYGLFALTALYVFLCVYFHLGEPVGFLLGILCFLPALLAVFLWALARHLSGRSKPENGKAGSS